MQLYKWNFLKIFPTTSTLYAGMCFCLSRVNLFFIKFSESEKWSRWNRMLLPVFTFYWYWLVRAQRSWSCLHSFRASDEVGVYPYRTISTYPTVMSKILLPTELDTAMSPSPFRATMTLVIRSGMEVPAAKMVRPIISSLMPIVSPT